MQVERQSVGLEMHPFHRKPYSRLHRETMRFGLPILESGRLRGQPKMQYGSKWYPALDMRTMMGRE
jgi:hypothetical protein